MDPTRRRPSEETLRWVERSVGERARVVGWRRLTGGITSSMHRLSVDTGTSGAIEQFVLRRWLWKTRDGQPARDQWKWWTKQAVEQEFAVLTALAESKIPAPRPVAWVAGAEYDCACLLMRRAPGKMLLTPRDQHDWVRQMAEMLPRIHHVNIDAPDLESWIDPATKQPPVGTQRPDLWREALDSIRDIWPGNERCFIHRDYQHFNLLWSRDRLSTVVDWANASCGPPDIDVGHCRLNLAVLFSPELAEEFRQIYESAAGRKVDPRWDMHSLLSYDKQWQDFIPVQVHGRAPIDAAGMGERVETVIAGALSRL